MATTATTKKLNYNLTNPAPAPYTPAPLAPVKAPLPGPMANATVPGQAPLGATAAPSSSQLQSVMDMIGSKGGQTLIGAAGAGLQAYGQGKASDKQLAQQAHQFDVTTGLNQANNDEQMQLSRATNATNATPLGQDQGFAQRQAILKTILGGARNVSYAPGDPAVQAAMGSHSGGLTLPSSGLDPAMLERLFGDEATQASIAQRAKNVGHIDPTAATPNFASMFGTSTDGSENAFQTDVNTSNANALQAQDAEHARQRDIISRAIDEDLTGEKQPGAKEGTPWWKKALKIAAIAAPIVAAPFTGGASLALIGAGSGAASGLLNGGGVKGALTGAALGAIPMGGAGGGAASGVKAGLKVAAKKAVTNPNVIMNAIGAAR